MSVLDPYIAFTSVFGLFAARGQTKSPVLWGGPAMARRLRLDSALD